MSREPTIAWVKHNTPIHMSYLTNLVIDNADRQVATHHRTR
jgi:hypothetical protein